MIELSRLNGRSIIVNAELIKFVEDSPDTVITLVTGDKLVVREPVSEVMRKTLAYRRSLLHREAETCGSELQSPAECNDSGSRSGK